MELLEVVVWFGGVREREKEGGVRENGGREVEERIEREVRDRRSIGERKKEERKTYSSMSASPLLAMSTSLAPGLHSATTALRAAVEGGIGWRGNKGGERGTRRGGG